MAGTACLRRGSKARRVIEGRAKADLPKVRATPLLQSQQRVYGLLQAQKGGQQGLTDLLSMFADDEELKGKGREESGVS